MVSKNQNLEYYVSLYNSEIGDKSRNILIEKIQKELEEDTTSICAYFCDKYLKNDLDKRYYYSEFMSISSESLLNALAVYDSNKNVDIIPLYITCFRNDLFDYLKSRDTVNSMKTLYHTEGIWDGDYEYIDEDVDKILLHDKIVSIINKIKFKKDIHKEIFLELIGITNNFKWKTKEDYADIIGYSRMGVHKLYNKYMKEFENIVNSSGKLQEELRQFL